MSKPAIRHIEKAKKIGFNNGHAFHLAAILFRGKDIIKIGTNSTKTHPKYHRVYSNGDEGSHLHAEMSVLRFSKPGDVITVMRWNSKGELTMSMPCTYCQEFIKDAGIKTVIYSNWDGKFCVMELNKG